MEYHLYRSEMREGEVRATQKRDKEVKPRRRETAEGKITMRKGGKNAQKEGGTD